jgi:hypothetical protein
VGVELDRKLAALLFSPGRHSTRCATDDLMNELGQYWWVFGVSGLVAPSDDLRTGYHHPVH